MESERLARAHLIAGVRAAVPASLPAALGFDPNFILGDSRDMAVRSVTPCLTWRKTHQ
jgi:hypothetical protein